MPAGSASASTTSSWATGGRTPGGSSSQLDHAELSLAGGEAAHGLRLARDVLDQSGLEAVPGGPVRARYVEAAALDALGEPDAAAAFQELLVDATESAIRLKAATALCRIWREHGQLDRAIAIAHAVAASVPAEALGSEEGIRLSVTLAAALFVAGRAEEAAELCDRAIAESERLELLRWPARPPTGTPASSAPSPETSARRSRSRSAPCTCSRTPSGSATSAGCAPSSAPSCSAPTLHASRTPRSSCGWRTPSSDWSEANPADKARNDLVNAQALLMRGETDRAHERALSVLDSCRDELPLISVDALTVLGQVAWTAGDRQAAQDWYRRAITMLTGFGADREAAQTWFEIGTLAAQAGLVAESADAFQRAAASTGLRARLPVISQPAVSPRTRPSFGAVQRGLRPRQDVALPARRAGTVWDHRGAVTAAVEGW